MSDAVERWLGEKFLNNSPLIGFIKELYPDAVTEAAMKSRVENVDAKAKAFYLIALSRLALKNTNLRNRLPGPAFVSLDASDFNGNTQRVQEIAANNGARGWPSPPTLFADKDLLKSAIAEGVARMTPKQTMPKSALGYAARLGATYGIDPTKKEETIYRFALFHRPLALSKTPQNKAAINELLFLLQDVKDFPATVRNELLDAFRQVGGEFIDNEPRLIDVKSTANQSDVSDAVASRGTERTLPDRSPRSFSKEQSSQSQTTHSPPVAEHVERGDAQQIEANLRDCNKTLIDTRAQLDAQRRAIGEANVRRLEAENSVAKQSEAHRVAVLSLNKLDAERADALARLATLTHKIDRILQLKEKCSTLGKSLADELGESMAASIETIATKHATAKVALAEQLSALNAQIETLEKHVSETYDEHCRCQAALERCKEEAVTNEQREQSLERDVSEQQALVADLQRKLAVADREKARCADSVQVLSLRNAQLAEKVAQKASETEASQTTIEALEQEVRELLATRDDLESREQRCRSNVRLQDEKCAAKLAQQDAELRNKLLLDCENERVQWRRQLEQCRAKNASAEANAVDLQEFIDAQAAELRTLEALRRENASLAQKVDALESENKQLARQLNEARQDVVAAAGAGKQLLLQVEQLKQQLAALR